MANTWIWISGWAIDTHRFKAAVEQTITDASHQVLAPTPSALDEVIANNVDCIGGYSLGSLILLSALDKISDDTTIVCLAPFMAFCKEDRLGGKTPGATLQALQRRLQKQPQKTLQLFYRLAGLSDPLPNDLPYAINSLLWGLEQLARLKADTTHLNRVNAIAGLKDPLIDVSLMRSRWPTCQFIDGCTHDYHKLLVALSHTEFI